MGTLLFVIIVLLGLWFYAIAPGPGKAAAFRPFVGRTFAHRGLYSKDQQVPENSLLAFLAAVEAGYGIELDVQLTRDGQVVVFHDASLLRACGVDARVDAYTYEELSKLSLFGTNHRIPLFSDVLALVDGRSPLIVELKGDGCWKRLCEITYALLKAYRGDYCVESFHPGPVRWFYKNAPEVLRGQLSEAYRYSKQFLPGYQAFGMSRVLTNALTHPQFLAYRIGPRCLSARACQWLGAMGVSWTAGPNDDWGMLARISDCIIFEHCRPATRFAKNDPSAPLLLELDPLISPKAEHITAATSKAPCANAVNQSTPATPASACQNSLRDC